MDFKKFFKKYGLGLVLLATALLAYVFYHSSHNVYNYKPANDIICPTKKTCLDKGNNCKCWCSHKCGPRDKEADDKPVYDNNDPNGNFCYCKQWDMDNVGRCSAKRLKR